jgi:hypothetical protein
MPYKRILDSSIREVFSKVNTNGDFLQAFD